MEDIILKFSELIEHVIYECDVQFQQYISMRPEEVQILLPHPILMLLERNGLVNFMSPESKLLIRGIDVKVGYENAIVIYCKAYTTYQEDWMIKKISLLPGFKLQDKHVQKIIYELVDISGIDPTNSSMN